MVSGTMLVADLLAPSGRENYPKAANLVELALITSTKYYPNTVAYEAVTHNVRQARMFILHSQSREIPEELVRYPQAVDIVEAIDGARSGIKVVEGLTTFDENGQSQPEHVSTIVQQGNSEGAHFAICFNANLINVFEESNEEDDIHAFTGALIIIATCHEAMRVVIRTVLAEISEEKGLKKGPADTRDAGYLLEDTLFGGRVSVIWNSSKTGKERISSIEALILVQGKGDLAKIDVDDLRAFVRGIKQHRFPRFKFQSLEALPGPSPPLAVGRRSAPTPTYGPPPTSLGPYAVSFIGPGCVC
ncbi:hypothetical protein MKEN_01224400 [Mycena kentingensis (nom. inval.)]|nr:hypothetical protein MKEN_01224400 [Mycena kentingensis (nom. inval.)]